MYENIKDRMMLAFRGFWWLFVAKTAIYWRFVAFRGRKNHTKTPQKWGFF